ncbi:MAG: hypothetical protein SFY81_06475 [Verrucomicrobiota bacterium]|nr:hypothetical protein [Verrucomicrobiota bacterium]
MDRAETESRKTLSVPPAATKYVLLQRTQLQKYHFKFLKKIGIDYSKWLVDWESRRHHEEISAGFLKSLQEDFNSLKPALPERLDNLLDIGCGIAGIDVLLNDHYKGQLNINLLDRTSIESRVYYDFHKQGAFYNSLELARETLIVNGVAPERIRLFEANDHNRIPLKEPVDLVLSLISWGFHYPVATYLSEVERILAPEGRLILDIRQGSGGMEDLIRAFARVEVLFQNPKYARVLARR